MSRQPQGRVETVEGVRTLVLTRTFAAPVEDVWAAVTEPGRMERWIGTWHGDPASGHVLFRMTAEGEEATDEEVEIRECAPPHRLAVTSRVGEDSWMLELDLVEDGGVTTLTFRQPHLGADEAESVGPGWEYYLDRLAAAETGADVGAIDFERDYYPAMREHYRSQPD